MRKILSKVAIAAAALVGFANAANAFVVLTITDGTNTLSCNTTSAVGTCDSRFTYAQNSSQITFDTVNTNNSFFGYTIQTTSGQGNVPGLPTFALVSTSNTTITNGSGASGLLTITLDAFGFTNPTSLGKTLVGQSAYTAPVNAGGADSVLGVFAAGNNTVAPFTTLASTTCSAVLTASTGSCAAGQINWVDPDGGFYSLRDQQQFTLANGTTVTGSSSLTVGIPEPTTTALVGAALLALGATTRRRTAKQALKQA